ncbi:hypothetical protein LX36DRAFT_23899 [Colletotrichum falcatum]|nr:hypothetical protein LX36DRAFT_23899 [Colletotrichum falcatum]
MSIVCAIVISIALDGYAPFKHGLQQKTRKGSSSVSPVSSVPRPSLFIFFFFFHQWGCSLCRPDPTWRLGCSDKARLRLRFGWGKAPHHMHMRHLSQIYHGSGMELQFHKGVHIRHGGLGKDNGKLQDFGLQNEIGQEKTVSFIVCGPSRRMLMVSACLK